MRTIHALLAGLLLGALGWWWMGHPGYTTRAQRLERLEAEARANEPRLYRWRDARGVLQVTDTPPPKGIKAERVDLREDVNVVPMSSPAEEAGGKPAPAR